jgi:hypothetical protein
VKSHRQQFVQTKIFGNEMTKSKYIQIVLACEDVVGGCRYLQKNVQIQKIMYVSDLLGMPLHSTQHLKSVELTI